MLFRMCLMIEDTEGKFFSIFPIKRFFDQGYRDLHGEIVLFRETYCTYEDVFSRGGLSTARLKFVKVKNDVVVLLDEMQIKVYSIRELSNKKILTEKFIFLGGERFEDFKLAEDQALLKEDY